jgi:hypothetical protein
MTLGNGLFSVSFLISYPNLYQVHQQLQVDDL